MLLMLLMAACSTTDRGEPVVNKHTWIWCWNQCGKADKLSAVSNSACICSNGGVIAMQPQLPEPEGPSLVEKFGSIIKGIAE